MSNLAYLPGHEPSKSQAPKENAKGPQVEDGYTRIANELLEQVMIAPLTSREIRVVMAVIRLTYGWNRKHARVTGGLLAKLTGMPATKASQTMASLVSKNVITRHGGSRSPVSINKHTDQWEVEKLERKTPPPKQAKPSETNQSGHDNPKRYDSYQNGKSQSYQIGNTSKERKDNPSSLRSEGGASDENPLDLELTPPTEPPAPKAKSSPKPKPTKLDLTNLPDGVSAEAAQAFIDHRKALKKPLTQRALTLSLGEAVKASHAIPGMTPDQAIDEAILAGWQGVKAQWLINRQGGGGAQLKPRQDGRKGFVQPKPVGSYTPTDMDNLPAWMRD